MYKWNLKSLFTPGLNTVGYPESQPTVFTAHQWKLHWMEESCRAGGCHTQWIWVIVFDSRSWLYALGNRGLEQRDEWLHHQDGFLLGKIRTTGVIVPVTASWGFRFATSGKGFGSDGLVGPRPGLTFCDSGPWYPSWSASLFPRFIFHHCCPLRRELLTCRRLPFLC